MSTDTFKDEVGAELDRVFGAEHVVRDAMIDPRTGDVTGTRAGHRVRLEHVDSDTGELRSVEVDGEAIQRAARKVHQPTLPSFEGMVVDTWQLSFGGTVEIDPDSEEGRALIERCRFGEPVTLTVAGVVVAVNGKYKPETDKADAEVTRGVRVAVDHVVIR